MANAIVDVLGVFQMIKNCADICVLNQEASYMKQITYIIQIN